MSCPHKGDADGSAKDACPVSDEARAVYAGLAGAPGGASPTTCPADGKVDTAGGVNVAVDAKNHMPSVPEQGAARGQRTTMSPTRVASSIPMTPDKGAVSVAVEGAGVGVGAGAGAGAGEGAEGGGAAAGTATGVGCGGDGAGAAEEVWQYPSEQMFYNALKRKGKGGDVREEDMNTVVSIHNAVNERTWRQLMAWEALHCDECATPKLSRFMGRPKDVTPKARFMQMLGYKLPFDRHDWIVDRCVGGNRDVCAWCVCGGVCGALVGTGTCVRGVCVVVCVVRWWEGGRMCVVCVWGGVCGAGWYGIRGDGRRRVQRWNFRYLRVLERKGRRERRCGVGRADWGMRLCLCPVCGRNTLNSISCIERARPWWR